jgi:hypothetical protein
MGSTSLWHKWHYSNYGIYGPLLLLQFTTTLPHFSEFANAPYYGPQSPTPDVSVPDYTFRTSTPTTAVGEEVQPVLADEGLEIVQIEDLEPSAPGTPRPYVHPRGEWMTNLGDDRPIHDVMMRTEKDGEELELPLFFRYNFNTDNSKLLITFGCNCRISSRPLRARPQPYPIQPFTRQ